MRKMVLFIFIALFFFSFTVYGQEQNTDSSTENAAENAKPETISSALHAGNVDVGGYGALSMKFSGLDQNEGFLTSDSFFAYLIGARGGITFNKKWTIGAGFYVLTNKFYYRCPAGDTSYFCTKDEGKNRMILGYGGLYFSYLFEIKKYIGVETGFLAGGGSFKGKKSREDYWDDDQLSASYSFFIFEPELQLVAKFTGYFGMALGIGYRILSVVESGSAYDLKDLSGPFLSLEARLGVF